MAQQEFDEYNLKAKIDFKIWAKVFKRLTKYKKFLFTAIISISLIAIAETLFTYAVANAITKYIPENNPALWSIDSIYQLVIALIALAIIQSLSLFLFLLCAGNLDLKFYSELTRETYSHLQELPFSFYDKNSVGWLLTRVTSDTMQLAEIISWAMIDLIWAMAKLTFIIVLMMMINYKIALIMLIIVPIMIFFSALFKKMLISIYRQVRRNNSKVTGALNEGISGAKTTKSLALEEKKNQEFKELSHKSYRLAIKSSFFTSVFYQLISFSTGVAVIVTGIIGGNMVLNQTLTLAMLILFFDYMRSFFEPVLNFASISNEMKHAQVSAERIFNLLSVKPAIADSPEVVEKYGDINNFKMENWEEILGDIEFKNVSFSYIQDQYILKDFNLKIKRGQSVAIVGETGAGKSTIVNLICRFYEPVLGTILIDGKDYKQRSISWLHHNLGYVLQTPYLFSGTIAENIRYGNLKASDQEVIEAAKIIGADAFIEELEGKYDYDVGESGNRLSMGQKQLISFARAIIADPKILILDEATSSVDTQTELQIQQAIAKIKQKRTSIIIAHRLSTIVNCNCIIVLQRGEIIESGTHQELLEKQGYYYRLYTNQFIEEKLLELNLKKS